MKRREFITLLGGTAAGWPLTARAQQPAMPVIGFLNFGSPQPLSSFATAFVQGLKETGHIDGQNVAIEYRWAGGATARLPQLAADLVARHVAVIAVFGTPPARIAKEAISGTPISMVFANGSDPVADGLVASMNRPGGNITGITSIAAAIVPKRLELLRGVILSSKTVAVLINPNNPVSVAELEGVQAAARSIGQNLEAINAGNASEVDLAFATLANRRIGGVIITTDLFYYGLMKRFAELAVQYKLPAIAPLKEFATAGGLMSYGASIPETYRQVGIYTGRILKGEKPADLPVVQPTKFDLVINLKTAKALGLDVPQNLLVAADEVIE